MANTQKTHLSYFDGPYGRIRNLKVLTIRNGTDLLFPYSNDSDPQKKQLHHHLFLDDKKKACGLVYITQNKQGQWCREFHYDRGWGWKLDGRSEYYNSIKELYNAIEYERDQRNVRNFAKYLVANFAILATRDDIIKELSEKHDNSSDSCFIATAAYSTSTHPDITTFRQFRDKYLLSHNLGRQTVKIYYKLGPSISDCISHQPMIQKIIRHQLEHLAKWMRNQGICKT